MRAVAKEPEREALWESRVLREPGFSQGRAQKARLMEFSRRFGKEWKRVLVDEKESAQNNVRMLFKL